MNEDPLQELLPIERKILIMVRQLGRHDKLQISYPHHNSNQLEIILTKTEIGVLNILDPKSMRIV